MTPQDAGSDEDHPQQGIPGRSGPGGALDITTMNGVTTRLHWTDQPCRWHANDGEEVLACSCVEAGGIQSRSTAIEQHHRSRPDIHT